MDAHELLHLYDREYAGIYDDSFLLGEYFRECTEYETSLIAGLLRPGWSWLDVGCGTGYFLSRFPAVQRSGLDLSSAMLERARVANPDVPFFERDYRVDVPEWHDRWHLVSCMWYAYCYAGSISEVETVIRNLAAWTAPDGACFLPVCDPSTLCKMAIPYRPPADSDDGRLEITAVVWNWIDEPSGRRHTGLIAPHLDHLISLFRSLFAEVDLHTYPQFQADCLASRKAIIAKRKRP